MNIEPPPPPPPPTELPIDERTGFFFQAGLGVSFASYRDKYTGQGAELGDDGVETAKGVGSAASLRIGGGLSSGIILGAGLVSSAGTYDYKDRSSEGTTVVELDASAVSLMVFFQKYIGAFFLRAELGLVGVSSGDDDGGAGLGFGLGTGADFLVSRSWALGFGVNFQRGSGEYDDADYSGEATLNLVTAHFTATYF